MSKTFNCTMDHYTRKYLHALFAVNYVFIYDFLFNKDKLGFLFTLIKMFTLASLFGWLPFSCHWSPVGPSGLALLWKRSNANTLCLILETIRPRGDGSELCPNNQCRVHWISEPEPEA